MNITSKMAPTSLCSTLRLLLAATCLQALPSAHSQDNSRLPPCTVTGGDSKHVILSVQESFGDDVEQDTFPAELPISGSPGQDMELSLFHLPEDRPDRDYFRLEGKRLRLIRPLDRDEEDLSSIMLQVRVDGILYMY